MKDMTNNKKPNAATSALDTATAKKIAEHYCHAKASTHTSRTRCLKNRMQR